MKSIFLNLLLACVLGLSAPSRAESEFRPLLPANFQVIGSILAIVPLPNGQILIGGDFETVNGIKQRYLARLNADGSLDSGWRPNLDYSVRRIVVDNGEVYVIGRVVSFDGFDTGLNRIRLDGDGSIDSEWRPKRSIPPFSVASFNEDIAVAGDFVYLLAIRVPNTTVRGARSIVARFFRSGSGTLDTSWKPKVISNKSNEGKIVADADHVYVAHRQTNQLQNDKRVITQRFSAAGYGEEDRRWRKAFAKGDQFTTFTQDAEYIYVAGSFQVARDVRRSVARISKATRQIDPVWFAAENTIVDRLAYNIAIKGGEAFVFHVDTTIGNSLFLRRIPLGSENPSGNASPTVKLAFTVATPSIGYRFTFATSKDDLFLPFTSTTKVSTLARVDTKTGVNDASFTPSFLKSALIQQVLRAPNGTTYVAGRFDAVGQVRRRNLARFNADGTLDTKWKPSPESEVEKIHLFNDSLFYSDQNKSFGKLSIASPARLDSMWDPKTALDTLHPGLTDECEFFGDSLFVIRSQNKINDFRKFFTRIPLSGNGAVDPNWDIDQGDDLISAKIVAHEGYVYVIKYSGPIERYTVGSPGIRDPAWNVAYDTAGGITFDAAFIYLSDSLGNIRRFSLTGVGARDNAWAPLRVGASFSDAVSLSAAGPWVYVARSKANDPGTTVLSRIGKSDAVLDPDFSVELPLVNKGAKWIGSLGDAPILGGFFSDLGGVPAAPPLIVNTLQAPLLSRTGTRIFAALDEVATLGIHFFRVTGLVGGTLATSDGTPLAQGAFVSLAVAAEGLDFTPDPNFDGARSLSLASAKEADIATTGADSATIDLTATQPPRNRYRMASPTITIREGSAQASVSVEKTGAAAGSVVFAVQENVARAGEHFNIPTNLTLDFPAGDSVGVIQVPLLDDLIFGGDRDFRVTLVSASDNGLLLAPLSTDVTIQDDDPLGDSNSLTTRPALGAVPAATGSLHASLNAPLGAWRLLGEAAWRAAGDAAIGLTRGNYFVEFRQANGFIAPPARTVPVDFGESVIVTGSYVALDIGAIGAVAVSIEPSSVADGSGDARGQWRLAGESVWRDDGETAENLPAGPYEVEFKPVTGRQTPPTQSVLVAGTVVYTITGTYLVDDSTGGSTPQPLDFATVQTSPYAYVGQIHTPIGFASGTAVRSRVVLTVGHALFDDVTLSSVTDARWYLQKARGEFEPPPATARGWYTFQGYSAQRAVDLAGSTGGVGVSTPDSQPLDVAAMWFLEPCARGSFAGYLRTEPGNDWLLAARRRILAGYPVEKVAENLRGIMHATSVDLPSTFSSPSESVRTTNDLRGFPGMSGGPLFVENEGAFYPAGIFLGGTAQTLVRVIDTQVIDLINRGETSGNGGDNNVGGGITLASPGITAAPFAPTLLGCFFGPAEAVIGGGGWRIAGEDTFRASGARVTRNPGTYRVEFRAFSGFAAPPSQVVQLVQGQIATVRATYRTGVRITSIVQPAGAGTAPTGDFPLGDEITLRARPSSNFLFDAWMENGNLVSHNALLTFVANTPRNLTAVFKEGSFVAYAGTYTGLHETDGQPDGLVSLAVTGNGRFTGSVIIRGRKHAIRGTFNEAGAFSGALGASAILLQIDRTTPTGSITGQIFSGGEPTRFTTSQSHFSRALPTALVGTYTLLFPPADAGDLALPTGHGYASLIVGPAGEVRFTGKLADGAPITGGTNVREDGSWPFFASLYSHGGRAVGSFTFRTRSGISDADGSVRWLRPASEPDRFFPDGYDTVLQAVASRYNPPAVDFTTADATITNGGFTSPLQREISFTPMFAAASADGTIRIAVQSRTGLFTGTALDSAAQKKYPLAGAVFQTTSSLHGYHRGSIPHTGRVNILAAP